jgi:two-component system CheB/CheR fusion protein
MQIENFQVDHDFEQIRHKTLLLNAQKMNQTNGDEFILLAIADSSDRPRPELDLTHA